jgi:predicted short-subunit dehydrogenase-like oxidoreductase (DUF2520 family)
MRPPRPSRGPRRSKAKLRSRTPARSKYPRVVIAGFGRLGGAIAQGLTRAQWPLSVFPRSDASVRRAAELSLKLADHDDLQNADVCVLAVPDQAVAKLAQTLELDLGPGTALVHCAGALDLAVFGDNPQTQRRARGSFHPLCAVSDPRDDLTGHSVAISATPRTLLPTLEALATALGLKPLEVSEARRPIYHAAAVLCAGGLTALASAGVAGFAEAGIGEKEALEALLPLMKSALRGVSQRGLSRGLTGPVARGDLATVQSHLAALPADLSELYRQLALRALELARETLPVETRNALEKNLRRS